MQVSVRLGRVATRQEDRLILTSPWLLRDISKSIPGAAWSPEDKVWHYPATATAASSVRDGFSGHTLAIDDNARHLFAAAVEGEALRGEEEKVDLSTLPTCLETMFLPPRLKQRIGVQLFLSQPATLLHWDMGVGKSYVVVAAAHEGPLDPMLISAPAKVVPVWKREFAKHSRKPYDLLCLDPDDGMSVARRAALFEKFIAKPGGGPLGPRVVVINHEAVWRPPIGPKFEKQGRANVCVDVGLLGKVDWAAVVVDEIHRIKDAQTNVCDCLCRYVRPKAKRRIGLTGTPLPNGPLDAFGQFKFLDPGVFGESYVRFRDTYAVMKSAGNVKWPVGYKNLDDFNKKFYSIAHRVRAEDVLDLPGRSHHTIVVKLPPDVRAMYDRLEEHMCAEVEAGVITASNAFTKLLALQKMTSGFATVEDLDEDTKTLQVLHHLKRDALVEFLEALPIDERVAVFCRFRHDLDEIHEAAKIAGRTSLELSGRRDEVKGYWNLGPQTVLAVQIQAGGVGIDLTTARYQLFLSVGYNNGDYMQGLKRLDRQGQTHKVMIYHMVCDATEDVNVYDSLQRKTDVTASALDRFRRKARPMTAVELDRAEASISAHLSAAG